jgi:hypothetical protein
MEPLAQAEQLEVIEEKGAEERHGKPEQAAGAKRERRRSLRVEQLLGTPRNV